MVDDIRSEDNLGGLDGQSRRVRREQKETAPRPLTDREVPLGQQEPMGRVLAPTVHAWLDGELPEATVRKGTTARDVEFWNSVNTEAERRRRVRTPTYLEAQIMEALPQTAPAVITPWWRREFVITPMAALGAATALVATAAALTAALVRR
jgi:hypothetical protein